MVIDKISSDPYRHYIITLKVSILINLSIAYPLIISSDILKQRALT